MLRRLFLVFLPSLTASVSYANEASWNCEQNKDSKEWVCIGEKKQTTQANKATPPVKREPVRALQPALTHAVEKKPVDTTPSLEVTAPSKPISAKPVQPVIAEPVRVAKPVTPTPVETRQAFRPQPIQASTPVTTKSVESLQTTKSAPAKGNQPVASKSAENIQPTVSAPTKPAVDSSKMPSGNEAKQSGWSCGANKADESWNCQLVGAETKGKSEVTSASEPKGNAEMVKAGEPMMRLLTPAFDHEQEQIFSTLVSQLKYDPWESCSVGTGTNRNF
ncbi:MAG: hypothetical protein WCH01_02410, partial [Methylococcaceae bacterium]